MILTEASEEIWRRAEQYPGVFSAYLLPLNKKRYLLI